MKNIWILGVLVLLLSTSCTNNSNDENTNIVEINDSNISGTWNYTDYSYNQQNMQTIDGVVVAEYASEAKGTDYNMTLTFDVENNQTITNGSLTLNYSVDIPGFGNSTNSFPFSVSQQVSSYSREGANLLIDNGMVMSDSNGSVGLEILENTTVITELTANQMVLEFTNVVVHKQEGISVETTTSGILVLTR